MLEGLDGRVIFRVKDVFMFFYLVFLVLVYIWKLFLVLLFIIINIWDDLIFMGECGLMEIVYRYLMFVCMFSDRDMWNCSCILYEFVLV